MSHALVHIFNVRCIFGYKNLRSTSSKNIKQPVPALQRLFETSSDGSCYFSR